MSAEQSNQCEEIQPWLAAYALGEAADEAAAQAHLADCPHCQRSLYEYRIVAGALPYDAPDAAPSAELRERIIDAVKRQAAGSAPPATFISGRPASAHAERTKEPHPPAHAPAPPRRARRARSFWAASALAVLAAALLFWNIALRRELDEQVAAVVRNRQDWQTMIVLLNDSALRSYLISGDPSSGAAQAAARGHFWIVPQNPVACLVAQGLPDLPEGQVYQVWLVRGAWQISGGTFKAHNGNAWILVHGDKPLDAYSSIFVTVEPDGGSQAPAGPRVMSGGLAVAMAPGSANRHEVLILLEGARPFSD